MSARLAQSVEHETLNLRVVGSSPTLGDNLFFYASACTFKNHYQYFFVLQNLREKVGHMHSTVSGPLAEEINL